MKKILLSLLLISAGCASTSHTPSSATQVEVTPPSALTGAQDNLSCAHGVAPGCSSPVAVPVQPMPLPGVTDLNCAHRGADGTCYHPM